MRYWTNDGGFISDVVKGSQSDRCAAESDLKVPTTRRGFMCTVSIATAAITLNLYTYGAVPTHRTNFHVEAAGVAASRVVDKHSKKLVSLPRTSPVKKLFAKRDVSVPR